MYKQVIFEVFNLSLMLRKYVFLEKVAHRKFKLDLIKSLNDVNQISHALATKLDLIKS